MCFMISWQQQAMMKSKTQAQKEQKNNTRDSNVVPHRSTNRARTCLTSLSRREAVLSCWYGRSYYEWDSQSICTVCCLTTKFYSTVWYPAYYQLHALRAAPCANEGLPACTTAQTTITIKPINIQYKQLLTVVKFLCNQQHKLCNSTKKHLGCFLSLATSPTLNTTFSISCNS